MVCRQLNPIASKLSPLRYFGDWRVNQYYRRTLNSEAMAQEWGRHALFGLNLEHGAAVLDHGCGRGRHVAFLRQLGFSVAAQDIESHPAWKGIRGCVFQKAPMTAPRLPWRDRVFSLVIDSTVIQNFSKDRLQALALEIFRVLVPGGYWIIEEANDSSYGAATMKGLIPYLHSADTVKAICKRAGFNEIDLIYSGFIAPIFPFATDFVRRMLWPGPLDIDDHRSWLAVKVEAKRRKRWQLRLVKPA